MFIASGWKDYEVIDTGDGEKLERWQDVILRRPDPQAIWPKQRPELWTRADAHYHRSAKGGGEWEFFQKAARALDGVVWRIALLRPPHGLQAHRPFPGTGRQLGLDGRAHPRGEAPHQGAQSLRLHGRGNGGLRPRRRAGDACGRGQGHGAVGGGRTAA